MFSASNADYVSQVVDVIDPKHSYIHLGLSRESCIQIDSHYVKDLRVLGNRELANVVIVDNTPVCFYANLDNGIYIPSYFGASDDVELMKIARFLLEVEGVEDVRPYVAQFAGIKRLYAAYSAIHANKPDCG